MPKTDTETEKVTLQRGDETREFSTEHDVIVRAMAAGWRMPKVEDEASVGSTDQRPTDQPEEATGADEEGVTDGL